APADQAEDTAVPTTPDIAAAAAAVKAAPLDVATARASRMPSISAQATNNYTHYTQGSQNPFTGATARLEGDSASVGVSLNLPLYQGGGPSAQIRQAQDLEQVAMEQQTA